MSGEGPESIPTSADRRSKRPVKKRALTPVSAQAAGLNALFAKPDQTIKLPVSADVARLRGSGGGGGGGSAPPEIIANVQGSSSGAGSGEFHVYKASRRREYARLRALDEAAARDRDSEDFERAKKEREARDDEKTKRNREKREKAKARKAKGKKAGGGGAPATTARPVAPPQNGGSENGHKGAQPRGHGQADSSGDEGPALPPAASTADGADSAAEAPGLLIQDDDD